MNYTKTALTASLVIFSLIFLLHVIRILTGFHAQMGTWVVPIWLNVIAAIISLVVMYLNYKGLKGA